MELNNKQIIILVSVVVLILIISFYLTYKSGQKTIKATNLKITNKIVGTSSLNDIQKQDLKSLSINLHNDMEGFNRTWNEDLYNSIDVLTDTELVALSNIFNAMYEAESGDTFYQWLDSQYFTWYSFDLQEQNDLIMGRMLAIGIN